VSEEKILEILERAGPGGLLQSEIQKFLGLSKSWVSELLSSMERRGLIVRSKGPGKTRIVRLSRYADPSLSGVLTIGMVPSAEYIPLPLLAKAARGYGFKVEPYIKRSVLDVAIGFMRGEYRLAYLPIYTLPLLKVLGIGFKIIGAVALGGASIVGKSLPDAVSILSSMLSTMEVLSVAYLRSSKTVSKPSSAYRVKYYRDPDEAVETLEGRGDVAAMLWEPYSSIAEARGLKRIPVSELLGEYHCCVLIAGEDLHQEILEKVKKAHIESIETLPTRIDAISHGFSEIVGLPHTMVKKAYREYTFTHQIDLGILGSIARAAEGFLVNSELLEGVARSSI